MNTQQQSMFIAASTSSGAAWILCDWLIECSDVPEEGDYLLEMLNMGESGWSLGRYGYGYGNRDGNGHGYGYGNGDGYGYGDGDGDGYGYGDGDGE